MRLGHLAVPHDVLIVAEIGNNHEGRLDVAERLVREAAACGADAVKFQTFQTRYFVRPADVARFQRLSRFELSPDAFAHLQRVAKSEGLLFLSTPLDLPSVDVLCDLVDAYKIASGDNTFYPLIDAVCDTGRPMIVSSGATDLALLREITRHIEGRWSVRGVAPGLAVLHCVSCYPAPSDQIGLAAIGTLARELSVPVGYSDHTIGAEACVLAAALGAQIIEKHFTLDRHFSDFRDHQLSSDPAELRVLVTRVREASAMRGSADKGVCPCEVEMVPAIRRSIVAASPLPAGHRIARNDLMWMRPAGGLAPGREAEVVGRLLVRAVGTGDAILPDNLE